MKKLLVGLFFLALFSSSFPICAQNVVGKSVKSVAKGAIKSKVAKEITEKEAKILLKKGIKETGGKYTGEALSEQVVKRAARSKVRKSMEKEGVESFVELGNKKAGKELSKLSSSRHVNLTNTKNRISYKNRLLAKKSAGKNAKNGANLVKSYTGKQGYKNFMSKGIKERMLHIQELANHIYSLPAKDREALLAKMSPEMRNKIIKVRQLQMGRLPSAKKGKWTGEPGNSTFQLSDSYVWTDPKTKQKITVGQLRKKYNINQPICVKYKNGEPDFSNYAIGKVGVKYEPHYRYSGQNGLIDLHNQAMEKLQKSGWQKNKWNKDAINPVADIKENMDNKGNYVRGCRNTFHEARDGETILIVPDFINNVCSHNGGRSIAAAVL